jgi:uncharacterized protein involved in exopolysaccharide biosynthesis/Mrp family chromosome partitioning ATPase
MQDWTEALAMAEIRRQPQDDSGLHLNDVLFALFKRKWTVLLCALLGVIAAAAAYFLWPAMYESEAKLLVRYVVERSGVDPVEAEKAVSASNDEGERAIGAEVEILRSWDLAVQVAEAIGPKRLGASSKEAAAMNILSGLKVISNKASNIIFISYKNRDAQTATAVLQELLGRYFVKHLEVHRSAGAFDFVTQQTDQVRTRLSQTEDALRTLKQKTGIASLKEGREALTAEASKTREALNAAEADLAKEQTLVRQIGDTKSRRWKANESAEKSSVPGKVRVAGAQAKVDTLKSRLNDVEQRMQKLSEVAPEMADLERKREMDEGNYKYFAASLEKARVDEALDPSKMPNISAVQRPSPPILDTKRRDKIALCLAGAGLALGIGIVLLREIVLNRTLGRPLELETRLQIPLMLSIPYTNSRNGHSPLASNGAPSNGTTPARPPQHSHLAPWDAGHFMRPYCDAIRDRLGLYFELNNLTHKPKLVGVVAFSEAAGASTLAAGLAASLSDANEGKVLLVDVNLGPEEVHPFFRGKPAYPLMAALKPHSDISCASDNLYLATVGSVSSRGLAQVGLKKFFDMMPNMKASDFDYIIFDMPPLHQTSPTWGMAAFMDQLLLVVEAEKNTRGMIKRGYGKLTAERANVTVIVNKTRSYVPKSLNFEA